MTQTTNMYVYKQRTVSVNNTMLASRHVSGNYMTVCTTTQDVLLDKMTHSTNIYTISCSIKHAHAMWLR